MFNKFISKKYAIEYLENEIKEISSRWAGFTINKRALEKEKETWIPFGKTSEERFEGLYNELRKKTKQQDQDRLLSHLSPEDQKSFNDFSERRNKEDALEKATEGLKEFEEFLEIATSLQQELEKESKSPSDIN